MTLILLPLAFIFIYSGLRLLPRHVDLYDRFNRAVLIFSLMIVFSTEILSLLNLYSFNGLTLFWTMFNISSLVFISIRYKHLQIELLNFTVLQKIRNSNRMERLFWMIIILLLSGLLFQGLIYPPNNWDSMTYHMARIVHWVQNNNVNYYPTSIIRQLYQPPFAEFFISQICILSKTDIWANFVQLFFLVSILYIMAGIARELGLPAYQQLLTLLLVITIPEVILQSSGTQNDVVLSYFIASSVYYCFTCYKKGFPGQFLFLGLSIGLAILTKATAFIFLAPVVLVFALAVLLRELKRRQWGWVYKFLILILTVLMINCGFFYRNCMLSGNILGTTQSDNRLYANEEHTPSALISNITRNAALHYGVPVFSELAENTVRMAHRWMRIDPENPGTTFAYYKDFKVNPYGTHEDYGANILQVSLILVIFIACLLFPRKAKKEILSYFLLIILMFLLFCFYLKWQPWHCRLHTPLFILITPVMAYFLLTFIPKKIFFVIFLLISFYALLVITFNYSRPLYRMTPYTADIKLTDGRFKKYFANRNIVFSDYQTIHDYIKAKDYKNIGLKLGIDDWEYPLFVDGFNQPLRAVHIDVENISRDTPVSRIEIDCIVSTVKSEDLMHQGVKYHIFTPENSILFLYKR